MILEPCDNGLHQRGNIPKTSDELIDEGARVASQNHTRTLETKRKRFLLIAISAVIVFTLAGWFFYRSILNEYHAGDYIELLKFMPPEPEVSGHAVRLTRVSEHLDPDDIETRIGPRQLAVFRSRHSLMPCSDGITVRNHKVSIPPFANLLKEKNQSSGWSYFAPESFTLFDGGATTPFPLQDASEVYKDTRHYNSGLIQWKFWAAGMFPKNQRLKILFFLDQNIIGSVKVTNRNYRTYEMQAFLREGPHTVSLQYVNDVSDSGTKSEEGVLISRVTAESTGSLLVGSVPASGIDVEYCTPDPIEPFSARAEVNGDVQQSLQFPAFSKIGFRLKLPQSPRLKFAITALANGTAEREKAELTVSVKPLLRSARSIFSYSAPAKFEWQNQEIDLSEFAGKPVILEFESRISGKHLLHDRTIAVSNPRIISAKLTQKAIPHIFIITADALRADHLGCYGYAKPTSPMIDSFAQDSILFQNAISQGAATLPSTSSLFTSVFPSSHKTDVNTSRLPSKFQTLPEIVHANGYMTAGFVKNEFLDPPHGLTDGFLWYHYDRFGTPTEERIPPALKWIDETRDLPQFVFFHMLHPHSPYIPPLEIANLFHVAYSPLASSNQKLREMDSKRILLSPSEHEHLLTLYDAEIRHLDGLFGQFVNHLKKLNIYDESLIIFLSDHGEAFQEHNRWGHGSTVYQEMIHVPLIIKLPVKYKKKKITVTQYVQTMDLMPTILELLGTSTPQWMQGRSLLPAVNGKAFDRSVFSEVLSGQMLAIIHNGMKYIYFGHSKKEEIYDLNMDSAETIELSRTRPGLLETFRKERSAFYEAAKEWRLKHIGQDSGEHIRLDENQTEELRALGYIR